MAFFFAAVVSRIAFGVADLREGRRNLRDVPTASQVHGVAHRRRYAGSVAVSVDEARNLALSLPEAVELDHHGRPSFRVGGKIFATLWNEARMNVMLDEGGILTAVDSAPDACEKVWWGKRLAAVGVALPRVERELLSELLTDAWEHKAPKRLLR